MTIVLSTSYFLSPSLGLDLGGFLKSFEEETGIGGILNTSFNLHGNPIVWNPEIAIDTFQNSELDALALGNYLLKK